MKCPHCGQTHSDDTKFCPQTGKKLESPFWLCENPKCNFRLPLPLSANFCPNCRWQKLNSSNNVGESSGVLFMTDSESGIILFDVNGNIIEKNLLLVSGDKIENWDFHYIRESGERFVIDTANKSHNLILVTKHDTEQLYIVSSKGLITVCDYTNGKNMQEQNYNYSKFCKTKNKYIQVGDFDRKISSFYEYNNGTVVKLFEFNLEYDKTLDDVITYFKYATNNKFGLWHNPLKFLQEESDCYPLEIKTGKYVRFNSYKWVAYAFSSKEGDYFCASKTMPTDENSSQINLDLVDANGNFMFSLGSKFPTAYLGEYRFEYGMSPCTTIFPVVDVIGNTGFMDIDGKVILPPASYSDVTLREDGNYGFKEGYNEKVLNVEDGQLYKQVYDDYLIELPDDYESIVRHRKTGKILSKHCLQMCPIPALNLYILAESKDGYWDDERMLLDKDGNVVSKINIYPVEDKSIKVVSYLERNMCWFNVDHSYRWASFDNTLKNVKLYDGTCGPGSRPQFGILPLIIETEGKNEPYISYVDISYDTSNLIPWNIPERKKNLHRIESFAPNVILVTMQDKTQYLINYEGNVILSGKLWMSIHKISINYFIACSCQNFSMNLFDMTGKLVMSFNSLFPNERPSMSNLFIISH